MATDGGPEPPRRVVPVADSATLGEETAAVGVRRQRIGEEAPTEKPYRRTQHLPPPGRHTKGYPAASAHRAQRRLGNERAREGDREDRARAETALDADLTLQLLD